MQHRLVILVRSPLHGAEVAHAHRSTPLCQHCLKMLTPVRLSQAHPQILMSSLEMPGGHCSACFSCFLSCFKMEKKCRNKVTATVAAQVTFNTRKVLKLVICSKNKLNNLRSQVFHVFLFFKQISIVDLNKKFFYSHSPS